MLLYQNDLETQQSNFNEVSVIISQADIIATVPEVYEPSQKFTLFMSRDDLRSVEEIQSLSSENPIIMGSHDPQPPILRNFAELQEKGVYEMIPNEVRRTKSFYEQSREKKPDAIFDRLSAISEQKSQNQRMSHEGSSSCIIFKAE